MSGNNWKGSFVVSDNDTNGEITFSIKSTTLNTEYSLTTNGSRVDINNPIITASPTPTYTVTNTPSPTMAANNSTVSSKQSGGDSRSFAPGCKDSMPIGTPDLFQIDFNNESAIVYYSPVSSEVSGYYLAYGENKSNLIHGVEIKQGKSNGVLSFKVNSLKPKTTYYFQIRSQSGCATGEWSSILAIKTNKNQVNKYNKVYKYKKISLTNILKKVKLRS